MSWQEQRACRNSPPEWFFPSERGGGAINPDWELAVEVCRRCPVTEECLALGKALGANGIWGGKRLVIDKVALANTRLVALHSEVDGKWERERVA